jgi:hypothetical protein
VEEPDPAEVGCQVVAVECRILASIGLPGSRLLCTDATCEGKSRVGRQEEARARGVVEQLPVACERDEKVKRAVGEDVDSPFVKQ